MIGWFQSERTKHNFSGFSSQFKAIKNTDVEKYAAIEDFSINVENFDRRWNVLVDCRQTSHDLLFFSTEIEKLFELFRLFVAGRFFEIRRCRSRVLRVSDEFNGSSLFFFFDVCRSVSVIRRIFFFRRIFSGAGTDAKVDFYFVVFRSSWLEYKNLLISLFLFKTRLFHFTSNGRC